MFFSISLPLSRNLTPSLSYHIVCKQIAKVTDFLSFYPFGISIFPFLTIGISMYQKSILPHFIIPYLYTPSFFPFGALRTDRQTEKILHPLLQHIVGYIVSSFFSTERAGPYPPKLGDHYSTHQGNYFVRTLAGRVATRKNNVFSST
jgi:hypothetical protein